MNKFGCTEHYQIYANCQFLYCVHITYHIIPCDQINIKTTRVPHITIFNLIINSENPDSNIFYDKKFYNQIKGIYQRTIANTHDPLILYTGPFPKNFTFPGFKPRYFLKNYKQSDPE